MTRAQCIVHRENRILMVRHRFRGRTWWCLPGGGVEAGETPEDAALRELAEECHMRGSIVRQTSLTHYPANKLTYTYLVEIGDHQPRMGSDPEFADHEQIIIDVQWLTLAQIPERDRAFLWQAGLLTIPIFRDQVIAWGDQSSYPV